MRRMSQLTDLAFAHQDARARVGRKAAVGALRLWARADVGNLDQSWSRLAPSIVQLVALGQVAAASQAEPFMASLAGAYGPTVVDATVNAEAFAGVTLDGREIGPALFGAVTTTKERIAAGFGAVRSFEAGSAFLAVVVKAAIADAGRNADNALATGKGYTRYIRVVSPGACSRCAILAGRGEYRTAFRRHPACKCTTLPIPSDDPFMPTPAGFFESPEAYFDSLSPAEQERVFTKAGAFAIRNGADPISVVNARRGYFGSAPAGVSVRRLKPVTIGVRADGSPLRVFATSEGTTARGAFARSEGNAALAAEKRGRYRRTTTLRLMPEQIQIMAGGNPERARELLARYGYLTL